MAFTRRLFLRHGILAAFVASIDRPLFAATGGRAPQGLEGLDPLQGTSAKQLKSGTWQQHATALNALGRDAFTRAIGTNFKVFLADNSADSSQIVWVTLLTVKDLPKMESASEASFAVPKKGHSPAPTSSGFILTFAGSSPLPQATHLFQHDSLGNFAMLTVPDGPQLYSAVINRLDQPAVISAPTQPGNNIRQNNVRQNTGSGEGNAVKLRALDATSAEVETRSPELSQNQGAQRGSLKD
ncbi:MAG TPA: hypothetical protein VGK22_21965 [Candidatus Angelobacter sp.]